MDKFDFTIGKNSPYVTWRASGLSFNGKCLQLLEYPKFVCIGVDRENRRLAVRASGNGRGGNASEYTFVTDERKRTSAMICSASLRRELKVILNARPPRCGLRFPAFFDGNAKMLIVDLNKRGWQG